MLSMWVFAPGAYSNDTWGQIKHAQIAYYSDWWDLGFTFLIRKLISICGSYTYMYYLLMMLYWVFVWILSFSLNIRKPVFGVYVLLAATCVFIPQYLMRDSLFVLLWGLALALMLYLPSIYNVVGRFFVLVFSLFLIVYGLWTRSNAVVAIAPILFIYLHLGFGRFLSKFWLFVLSGLLSILLLLGLRHFNFNTMKADKQYPTYKLMLYDVVGISKMCNRDFIPNDVKVTANFRFREVKNKYTASSVDNIYWDLPNVILEPNEQRASSMQKCWKHLIQKHPLLYLQNRWQGYMYYMRIHKFYKKEDYWNVNIDTGIGANTNKSAWKVRCHIVGFYQVLSQTWFFEPWFWLLFNFIAFVWFGIKSAQTKSSYWLYHMCIQLSGLMYTLSQFLVFQFDRDFRYFYWNLLLALFAMVAFSERRVPKKV